jgi:hypothetical protein
MYVFVRQDLPPPQQAVQAMHAAMEATRQGLTWEDHPHLVLCGVRNLTRLLACSDHLTRCQIPFTVWREPARGNEITAIATGLLHGDARRPLRKYQLLKLGDHNDHCCPV